MSKDDAWLKLCMALKHTDMRFSVRIGRGAYYNNHVAEARAAFEQAVLADSGRDDLLAACEMFVNSLEPFEKHEALSACEDAIAKAKGENSG